MAGVAAAGPCPGAGRLAPNARHLVSLHFKTPAVAVFWRRSRSPALALGPITSRSAKLACYMREGYTPVHRTRVPAPRSLRSRKAAGPPRSIRTWARQHAQSTVSAVPQLSLPWPPAADSSGSWLRSAPQPLGHHSLAAHCASGSPCHSRRGLSLSLTTQARPCSSWASTARA